MPRIVITTDRRPWVDGKPRAHGDVVDVSDTDAKTLAALGFAEVDAPKRAPKKDATGE